MDTVIAIGVGGIEDLDMKMRLDINNILISYRMGVYIPLFHKNLGLSLEKMYPEKIDIKKDIFVIFSISPKKSIQFYEYL